ncbi:retroviral-like aspartic protease family protein [Myxococcota bacterium]|nr:retroviral-like aspartic protease family protein [Myxococcota bacterium]
MPAPPRPSPTLRPDADSGLASALALLALPPLAVALALLLGAGVLHQGPPLFVSAAAGLLILLPAMGVAQLFRRRALGLALGLLLWPTAVVVGFPLYFPDQRADALASGATVLLMPLGMRVDPEQARTVDALLPGPQPVRPVAPRAQVLEAEPLPPSLAQAAPAGPAVAERDQVVLPYEGKGRSLAVQVGLEGPRDHADAWMLFDTGATLTTLDRASLDALGVPVLPDAPEVTVRTAGGERQARLALLDRVWIGGMEVQGVTVSVCDECADAETVGLLGLNVSGLFKVTVDSAREELVLEPRDGHLNRAVDVAPWLGLQATATRWEDGRIEVEVRGHNTSARTISQATVGIHCEDAWVAELRDLAPGQKASTVVALPVGVACTDFTIALERASW